MLNQAVFFLREAYFLVRVLLVCIVMLWEEEEDVCLVGLAATLLAWCPLELLEVELPLLVALLIPGAATFSLPKGVGLLAALVPLLCIGLLAALVPLLELSLAELGARVLLLPSLRPPSLAELGARVLLLPSLRPPFSLALVLPVPLGPMSMVSLLLLLSAFLLLLESGAGL